MEEGIKKLIIGNDCKVSESYNDSPTISNERIHSIEKRCSQHRFWLSVNMSDEDILDAMKSIIFWVVGGIIHRHCSGSHHKL